MATATKSLDILVGGHSRVAPVFAQVTQQTKQFAEKTKGIMRQVFEGFLRGTGAAFARRIFGGTQNVTATLGLTNWNQTVRDGITEAFNAEQAEAKLEAVLRSTGEAAGWSAGQLKDYSSELHKKTIFEDDAITNAQAILASMKSIKGDVFKHAIKSATDMSAVMGKDLTESVRAIGKALNDPDKGLRALGKASIFFDDATKGAIQYKMSLGDLEGAQKLILKELDSRFAGAAEGMAKKPTGMMKQLQNDFKNVVEEIGRSIAGMLAPMVPSLRSAMDSLQVWVPRVGELIRVAFGPIKEAAVQVGRVIGSIAREIGKAIMGAIGPVLRMGGNLFEKAFGKVTDWRSFQATFAGVMAAIQHNIENWEVALQLAWMTAKIGFMEMSEQIQHGFSETFRWIVEGFQDLVANAVAAAEAISMALAGDFKGAAGTGAKIGGSRPFVPAEFKDSKYLELMKQINRKVADDLAARIGQKVKDAMADALRGPGASAGFDAKPNMGGGVGLMTNGDRMKILAAAAPEGSGSGRMGSHLASFEQGRLLTGLGAAARDRDTVQTLAQEQKKLIENLLAEAKRQTEAQEEIKRNTKPEVEEPDDGEGL